MIRLLVLGFGLALGWSAVRNAPPLAGADHAVAVVLVLLALAGAYAAGRRRSGGATAIATATATATATAAAAGGAATVQLVVVNDANGARAAGTRALPGLDGAEWLAPGRPADDAVQLEELLLQEDAAQMAQEVQQ